MITCHFQYAGIFSMKLYYTLVLGTSGVVENSVIGRVSSEQVNECRESQA